MNKSTKTIPIWLLAGLLALTPAVSVSGAAMTEEAAAEETAEIVTEESTEAETAEETAAEESTAEETAPEQSETEESTAIEEELDASAETTLATPKLRKIVNSSSGPRIEWYAVTGCDGYQIMRKAEGGTWVKYDTVSGADTTTYTDNKAGAGKKYSYSVRCVKGTERSDYSRTGKTIVFLPAPKAILTNVIAGIRLNWAAVKGAESYVIYERDSSGTLHMLGATTELTYTVSGLNSGDTYRYTVRALTGTSYSGYSTVSKRWLKSPAVTTASDDRGVQLIWKSVKGAHYYQVYRKTSADSLQLLGSTLGLSWEDSEIPSVGNWSYCVRACDDQVRSSYITKTASVSHVHTYNSGESTAAGMRYTCTVCGSSRIEQSLPDCFGRYCFDEYAGILAQARESWEVSVPGVKEQDRSAPESLVDIPEPEYVQGSDGIYYSSEPEGNGIATIMLTGDLMCQSNQQKAAQNKYGTYNFADNFSYVSSILSSADLTVGNLETCLSESYSYMGEEYMVDGRYNCNAPSTYLDALRMAGFDLVSTANNHACDAGTVGIFQTLCHLDQYGLMHTGTYRTAEEPRYIIADVDGIRVGFLAYTTKTNGLSTCWDSEGQNVLLNIYSKERVTEDVAAVKAAGAEYIIAYNHWGTEYTNVSNEYERTCAAEMAEAGVDYIIGSHPHALQDYDVLETSDGREVPVAYSLGNFVSHQTRTISKETVILKLELTRDPEGNVVRRSEGYIPCRVYTTYSSCNYTVLPVGLPYSQGLVSQYFGTAWDDIRAALGTKISPLGTKRS